MCLLELSRSGLITYAYPLVIQRYCNETRTFSAIQIGTGVTQDLRDTVGPGHFAGIAAFCFTLKSEIIDLLRRKTQSDASGTSGHVEVGKPRSSPRTSCNSENFVFSTAATCPVTK